jgi:anti-anti-sigma factor
MAFTINSQIEDGIAKVNLIGEIDSLSARTFQQEIEKLAVQAPKELVLYMKELSFMSSAGLRVLIFAKQKIGPQLQIYMVQAQELIVDTLEKTGLQHSVHIVDKYPV